jgi:hypothetical protein
VKADAAAGRRQARSLPQHRRSPPRTSGAQLCSNRRASRCCGNRRGDRGRRESRARLSRARRRGRLPTQPGRRGNDHRPGRVRAIAAVGLGPGRRDAWYADAITEARTLLRAAENGDRRAFAAVAQAGRALREAAMAITAVIDPEVPVLGGPSASTRSCSLRCKTPSTSLPPPRPRSLPVLWVEIAPVGARNVAHVTRPAGTRGAVHRAGPAVGRCSDRSSSVGGVVVAAPLGRGRGAAGGCCSCARTHQVVLRHAAG